jgi:hypothetical protein
VEEYGGHKEPKAIFQRLATRNEKISNLYKIYESMFAQHAHKGAIL